MVIQAEPVLRAASHALGRKDRRYVKIVAFAPGGTQLSTEYAQTVAGRYRHLILICGRYEGIDARVQKILRAEEVSIGPYVLTGGELPAMVLIDTVARQLPGVLGSADSLEETRVASSEVYTRPAELTWRGATYPVPAVLREGNHQAIDAWRAAAPGGAPRSSAEGPPEEQPGDNPS
jgi:tRNA (guanine37-N1)-methyltransferase